MPLKPQHHFVFRLLLLFASLFSIVEAGASSNARERVINRSGIVVFREKSFYTDDLVKSARFSRIEDRTALDNPSYGYFVFFTAGGELQLPPQAIEERFFLDEFEFPKLMKPAQDIDSLAGLKDSLERVSRFNDAVRQVLATPLERITEAVRRLHNDEWWESPRGWISREDRDKRTAQSEKSAIDAAAESIKRSLGDANEIDQVGRAFESVISVEKLPATSPEVAAYRQSLALQLRTEADQRRLELEKAFVENAHAKLKVAVENAGSLKELLAAAAKMEELARAPVSAPQSLSLRVRCTDEISSLLKTKERKSRLKEAAFDSLNAWRKALDESASLEASSDPDMANIIRHSQTHYEQALEIGKNLDAASENLRAFFANLSMEAFASGEGLPLPPPSVEEAAKNYHDFVSGSGDSRTIAINELEQKAAYLKSNLESYQQLSALSAREKRRDLWRDLEVYSEVLGQMASVRRAISDEKTAYDAFVEAAQKHEAERDFAAAASSYQSAYDIAPSVDLANKIKAMKDQDLGL